MSDGVQNFLRGIEDLTSAVGRRYDRAKQIEGDQIARSAELTMRRRFSDFMRSLEKDPGPEDPTADLELHYTEILEKTRVSIFQEAGGEVKNAYAKRAIDAAYARLSEDWREEVRDYGRAKTVGRMRANADINADQIRTSESLTIPQKMDGIKNEYYTLYQNGMVTKAELYKALELNALDLGKNAILGEARSILDTRGVEAAEAFMQQVDTTFEYTGTGIEFSINEETRRQLIERVRDEHQYNEAIRKNRELASDQERIDDYIARGFERKNEKGEPVAVPGFKESYDSVPDLIQLKQYAKEDRSMFFDQQYGQQLLDVIEARIANLQADEARAVSGNNGPLTPEEKAFQADLLAMATNGVNTGPELARYRQKIMDGLYKGFFDRYGSKAVDEAYTWINRKKEGDLGLPGVTGIVNSLATAPKGEKPLLTETQAKGITFAVTRYAEQNPGVSADDLKKMALSLANPIIMNRKDLDGLSMDSGYTKDGWFFRDDADISKDEELMQAYQEGRFVSEADVQTVNEATQKQVVVTREDYIDKMYTQAKAYLPKDFPDLVGATVEKRVEYEYYPPRVTFMVTPRKGPQQQYMMKFISESDQELYIKSIMRTRNLTREQAEVLAPPKNDTSWFIYEHDPVTGKAGWMFAKKGVNQRKGLGEK